MCFDNRGLSKDLVGLLIMTWICHGYMDMHNEPHSLGSYPQRVLMARYGQVIQPSYSFMGRINSSFPTNSDEVLVVN